jgi:nifR3 family TIM-barrel protein
MAKNSFWHTSQKPLLLLAPMAGVTDTAFRQVICKYGRPHAVFTEFVSCNGLCSPGRERLLVDLKYNESERPVVAQVFGNRPETFFETAKLIRELGFDGLDINTGCPDKNVCKQGSGAALIGKQTLMAELIQAAKEGMGPDLPVSVKTRMGDTRDIVEEWTDMLLDSEPVAITIHCRTRAEMSKVPARWEAIARAKQVAVDRGSEVLILGNGDVTSIQQAKELAAETQADGVMIGRGIYGNPWLFNPGVDRDVDIPVGERLRVMVEHTRLYEEELMPVKSFLLMKKHYKAYSSGFAEAKDLRIKLMETTCADEVEAVVDDFIKTHPSIAANPPDPSGLVEV